VVVLVCASDPDGEQTVAVSPFASFKHVREEFAVAVQDALPIVPQDTTRHASVLVSDF